MASFCKKAFLFVKAGFWLVSVVFNFLGGETMLGWIGIGWGYGGVCTGDDSSLQPGK